MTGIIGGILATLLLTWLASRAKRDAALRSGRFVIEYGRAVKAVGWFFALLGIFILYAAAHASEDQKLIAAVVGGSMFIASIAIFVEFHFVRVEFDADTIYTFSPWRRRRVISWDDITAIGYSEVNRWHILHTAHSGAIRLSILLSGLGSMENQLQKRKIQANKS